MNLKKAVCAVNHTGAGGPAIFRVSITATAAIAAASSAVPIGVAGRGGTIRRRAVAAEPGKQVPTVTARTVTRTHGGSVAARALAQGLAVLPPVHQQIADQRGSSDRHHECRHSACHRVLHSKAGKNFWYLRTVICRFVPFSSSRNCGPFIDHS